MRPFVLERADAPENAVIAARMDEPGTIPPNQAPAQFIAGGTTILDLMKLDVMTPDRLVNIAKIPAGIEATPDGLRLGGAVRMAEAAENEIVKRDFPVIADTLKLAASQQIRNMASLAGNVLQRTRCPYFRDVSYTACNKRNPGSGCSALDGHNRLHAVLGTSNDCIATYPGDLAQALIALDAQVETLGPDGARSFDFLELHKEPRTTPDVETSLAPGELITAFVVPYGPWTRRSLYLKIRDRQSYEFALASAAVALQIEDGIVLEARIALGGVATRPWRSRAAEEAVIGEPLDEASAAVAGEAAFRGARTYRHNAFKVELGKRTVARALIDAGRMNV